MSWTRALLMLMVVLTILAVLLDNWTTYIALTEYAEYGVYEANPLAEWLFQTFGFVSCLVVNSILMPLGILFLAQTSWVRRERVRILLLGIVLSLRGGAALNNWLVITALGG